MKGYKLLNDDLTNQYGFKYELNKNYYLIGNLIWSKNGFHFCERVEDTFRYNESFDSNFIIVEVEATGDIVDYDDEYYGYYDMHASSIIKYNRIVPREEYIDIILNSNDPDRVKRLISSIKLNNYEIDKIRSKYNLEFFISYYQQKNVEKAYKLL